MVNLTIDNQVKDFAFEKTLFEKLLEQSLAKLGHGSNIEIELVFASSNSIQELNRKFRQKNEPTDVLSFPQKQFAIDKNILGSIVICPAIALERNEEIEELVKHGLLHLLGYDHETDEEEWDKIAETIGCHF